MKIAYVCTDPGIPVFGTKGASVHVREVIRAMRRAGHEVTLLARRVEGERPAGLESLEVIRLPPAIGPSPEARERTLLDANRDLALALDDAGPFDLVYERHALWSHAAMEWAFAREVPSILEVNAPLIEEQAKHRGLVLRQLAEFSRTRTFAAADAIVAVSDEVAQHAHANAASRGRVHVVPNGVDAQRFHPRVPASAPAPEGVLTIGFVGTLKPWHGVDVLIDAFAIVHASHPRTRLLIIGDGPEAARLRARASDRGIEGATYFTGPVDPDAVPGLVASMDLAVAPYPADEEHYFSPLKLFEYLAAGRAIVASRIGQTDRLVEHERTALLCEPGNAAAFAAAIARLHANVDLRRRLAANAREQAERRHTWDGVVSRILAIAEERRALRREGAVA